MRNVEGTEDTRRRSAGPTQHVPEAHTGKAHRATSGRRNIKADNERQMGSCGMRYVKAGSSRRRMYIDRNLAERALYKLQSAIAA